MRGNITVLLLFLVTSIYAQQNINGNVTDAITGEVLPGVSIMVKNTTRGTSTDFDGNFTIAVKKGEILKFSFIGFKTKEIVFKNQSFLKAVLEEDNAQLDEVIITSLGIKKEKKALGYAATELKARELTKASNEREFETSCTHHCLAPSWSQLASIRVRLLGCSG